MQYNWRKLSIEKPKTPSFTYYDEKNKINNLKLLAKMFGAEDILITKKDTALDNFGVYYNKKKNKIHLKNCTLSLVYNDNTEKVVIGGRTYE